MSAYLVTSPYGSQSYHSWACRAFMCAEGGGTSGSERDEIRAEATAHVTSAGHDVTIIDGTIEHLYPVATEAEQVTG